MSHPKEDHKMRNKIAIFGLPSLLLSATLFTGCGGGSSGSSAPPPTKYEGTIKLTRLGTHTDAGGVVHDYNETLELTGVTLNKIAEGIWLNSTGVNISTKAEINDSHILPESVDPTNWDNTYFTHALATFSQAETVVSLMPNDPGGLAPLLDYQLAVTGYNVPGVKEEATNKDGTITTYDKYPIPGQVVEFNKPANYGRIVGTHTETVDGIPWTMTWDFIGK
jgi:hypothetical protein